MSAETLADILAEMRHCIELASPRQRYAPKVSLRAWSNLADRIDAAAERDRGALVAEAEAAKCARNRVAVSLGVEYAERCRECKAKSGSAAAIREAREALTHNETTDALAVGGIVEAARQKQVGDAAAMRAALEPFPSLCDWLVANAGKDALGGGIQEMIHILRERADKARTALSAPPRNCDVGTPEEQARRFQLFCQAHRAFDADCSSKCPFVDTADINHCQSGWAQLPYEAEGGAE